MFPTHRIYLNSFKFPTVGTGPGDVVQISRLAGILQNYVLLSVGGGGGQMQTGADVSCPVCSAPVHADEMCRVEATTGISNCDRNRQLTPTQIFDINIRK